MRSPGPAFDLRASLVEELRAAIEELDASLAEPKAVHRCRVRVKRARALARVGRIAAPGLARVFNDTARGVMRTLGQARDLTAHAELAGKLARKAGGKAKAALTQLAESLTEARTEASGVNMEAARAGLKDLLALAQVWPESSPRQTHRGAERIAARARRAYRHGARAKDAPPRHEWRKREKDRFYAAELLGRHWPRKRKHRLGAKLGESLGQERDTLLLLDRVVVSPELAGEFAPRALKVLRKRREKLAKRADTLGARLHAGRA